MLVVEKELKDFLMSSKCSELLGGESAHVVKVSILVDVNGHRRDHGAQIPHTDWLVDTYGVKHPRRAAIIPTGAGSFSILLYVMSHIVVRSTATYHMCDEKAGFLDCSTVEGDRAFSEYLPVQEPIRLWLDDDQMLIFDGHLVHAGDESRFSSSDATSVLPNPRSVFVHG